MYMASSASAWFIQVIRKTISIVSLLLATSLLYFTPYFQAVSFFSLFLFVGMIIYFFVARYMLKWSTHGETGSGHSTRAGGSSQDAVDGPDDD